MNVKINVETFNAIFRHFTTKPKQNSLNFGTVKQIVSFQLISQPIDYVQHVKHQLNTDKDVNIWNVHIAKYRFVLSVFQSYKKIGNVEVLINFVGQLPKGSLCYEY